MLGGRSKGNVLGNRNNPSCMTGKKMVARSAIVAALSLLLSLVFAIEQPESSLMEKHPSIEWIREVCSRVDGWTYVMTRTCLGSFGGPRPKRTKLISNRVWFKELARGCAGKRLPSADEAGITQTLPDGRVAGGAELTSTQTYPVAFGDAVYQAWAGNEPAATLSASNVEQLDCQPSGCTPRWDIAELGEVLALFDVQSLTS